MAVFAIDAGGTWIKLGLVEHGRVLTRSALPACANEGLAAALPRIASALREISEAEVEGVAMALPSLVADDRIVGDVGKYRDAPDIDLAAWARDAFDAPFALENDARLATLGEWRHGAGRLAADEAYRNEVAAELSRQGFWALAPDVREVGPTRFLHDDTPRANDFAAIGQATDGAGSTGTRRGAPPRPPGTGARSGGRRRTRVAPRPR